MSEPLLSESREWTGHWWLPEDPENKVPGILSFHPRKGLSLRLIGGWEYRVMQPGPNGGVSVMNEFLSWPMIHGEANEKFVTVLGVNVRTASGFGLHNFFDGPKTMNLRAQTAIVGCLLEEPEERAFVAGIATVENLTQWSNYTGIVMQHHLPAEAGAVAGSIELTRLAPLTADLGEVTAKLHHVSWQPFADQPRSGTIARIKEQTSIEFASEDPKPVHEWLEHLSAIGDLISMSTLSACGLITIRLFLPATPERFPEDHPLRDQRHEIEVYMRRLVRPKPDMDGYRAWQMILTLADLSFDQLIPRWMEIHDKFAAARGMILGLHYVTGGFLETQVVTAVAAAESFHRALQLEPPIPDKEFAALRRLLLNAVPKKFKDWLSARIMRNEPTLKQRLAELATRPGDFMTQLVPDPARWAKAAGDARNSLAHVGATDEQQIDDLFAVVRVTEAVVIMNLLHEVGVPAERLAQAVERHPQLSHAATLGRKHFANT